MAKNSIYNVIYRISNLLFPLITSMYVARVLTENGVGQVAYAQNMASYFVTFASAGIADYGVREIAGVRNDSRKMNRLFTQLVVLNSLITAVSGLGYLLCVFLTREIVKQTNLLLICGLSVIFNGINVEWFYRGNEEYRYIVLRSIFLKFLLMFAVVFLVKDTQDYMIYALLVCLATGGNHIFNLVHLQKKVRLDFSGFELRKHISPLIVITFCAFLGTIYSKTDITMLGMMESAAAVGYYTYAHRTIDVVVTSCIAVTSVFLPRLSYYYQYDRAQFFRLLNLGMRLITFFAIPAFFGVMILSSEITELLYGPAFNPSATALRIFSVLIIIKGFGDLLCYQLVLCTGNEKKRIPAYLFAAVSNIILNFLLIPRWSFAGAAMASVISEMVVNGYQMVQMRKEVNLPMDKKAVLQALLSSGAMSIAVLIMKQIEISLIGRVCLAVFVGGTVYGCVNLFLKNKLLLDGIKKISCISR